MLYLESVVEKGKWKQADQVAARCIIYFGAEEGLVSHCRSRNGADEGIFFIDVGRDNEIFRIIQDLHCQG